MNLRGDGRKGAWGLAVALMVAAALAGPGTLAGLRAQQPIDEDEPLERPTAPIVIGSKPFPENRILAEIMAQLLRHRTDHPVELRDGLGGTLVAFTALKAGEIDLYPEYTGTGWAVVLAEEEPARDPLRTYVHVAREYERRFDIHWLEPFGFSNSYALAVRRPLADELGLASVSDLVPHAGSLRVGVSHEFLERPDGWPGLATTYGLEVADLRGMEHGLAFEALAEHELDVVDAWTTDGKLQRFDVTVLEDDLHYWPPYHCAPIVRRDLLERAPEVEDVLGLLALRLSDERMQQLNALVELDGRSFRDVARSFLVEEGLISPDQAAADAKADAGHAPGERRGDLLEFMGGRLGITLQLVLEHLLLTLGAVLSAVLFAVPLGVLLSRRRALAGPVLAAAGVIQTIPSLALLAFMIPLLGLGLDAAHAALFLYALLPILRNTYTGMRSLDPELLEAATGMGLSPRQVLRHVELPLALPTIMAGIRTATVITIGVATLAAFIGAGGLGEPIVTGLQLNDTRLVLAGAIPAALLAILADALLGALERRMTAGHRPSRRARSRRQLRV